MAENSASIIHFFVFKFNALKSALLPSANDRASKKIDFPAPVSPVITVKFPGKETSISLIKAKLLM